MASIKDEVSEPGEGEDLPSDFFDDFTKDEFMDGLSVIDEYWDETGGANKKRDSQTSIDADPIDGAKVKKLREQLPESKRKYTKKGANKNSVIDPKYRWIKPDSPSSQSSRNENCTKPGSRRDPNKTNEAIKKDKEVKVQQFLAKSLESSDDLRPPGTELDDYYEEVKKKRDPPLIEENASKEDSEINVKETAERPRRSPRLRPSPRPRRSPRLRHSPHSRHSPRRRGSPYHGVRNVSPVRHRHNFVRRSPVRTIRRNYSPHRRSPLRHGLSRRSPRSRYSPGRRSPQRQRSRSPRRRSHSRSPRRGDNFLYPNSMQIAPSYPPGMPPYHPEIGQQYVAPMHQEYLGNIPGNIPGYPYPQVPAYGGGFPDPYGGFGVPQVPQPTIPGPVPMPEINPVPAPELMNPVPPPMVPAPVVPAAEKATPYDALAQLVAEGKISQEDYLKLTPNKGQTSALDTRTRVMVLTRCRQALSKLDKLLLPSRLMINNHAIGAEEKYLAPKYCSPLKRQGVTEFSFTKESVSPEQHTKQLVESIISTLGLDKVVSKYKKKLPKDMKDASNQTSKPPCEICEIREATKFHDVGTSTDPEYFTSTVHTQVVEQDLFSSKSIFNPTGSVGEGAAISIAHMTPAQLVSQLAARAKTLKQPHDSPPPQNQFSRRPPSNYDYDGRGGQQYHHSYNNYRY